MEVPHVSEGKKCFYLNEHVITNVNVDFNIENMMTVFWNKYQILLYENLNFDTIARIIDPEFYIHFLIIMNNFILCLDCDGNMHIISLKFKNVVTKRLKTGFQLCALNIIACAKFNENVVLVIERQPKSVYICLHELNTSFPLIKKALIKHRNENWSPPTTPLNKCIITLYAANEVDLINIKRLFIKDDYYLGQNYIVLLTFDKLNVYSCLINLNAAEKEINLFKLYTCPSQICDMKILLQDSLVAVIALSVGTLIKLNFNEQTADIVHLNSSIYKFLPIKSSVIYTDGISMWRSDDTYISDIMFSQYFVKHVKDFIVFGDQILCTTFSNLIYIFPNDERCYTKALSYTEHYTHLLPNTLSDLNYLNKIMEEIDILESNLKKIHLENHYITALSLSNRHDIMNSIVKHKIKLYDTYEDAVKDNHEQIFLSENIANYFTDNLIYCLTQIKISEPQSLFTEILSTLLADLKLHITMVVNKKILKTTTVRITDIKKVNILTPVECKTLLKFCQINVQIKLVSNIPTAFNPNTPIWLLLYNNNTVLGCENFIKTELVTNIVHLKSPKQTIEDLINTTVQLQYGSLFKILNTWQYRSTTKWSFYLRISTIQVFRHEEQYTKFLFPRKAAFMYKHCSSEEFLSGRTKLTLEIFNVYVTLEIIEQPNSIKQLKITSDNVQYAYSIWLFFINFIENFDNYKPGVLFFSSSYLSSLVKFEAKATELSLSILQKDKDFFLPMAEEFEKNIIGMLPL